MTRLGKPARMIVVDAVRRAHDEGARQLAEEHLLAALTADPTTARLLDGAGTRDGMERLFEEMRLAHRRGGLSAADSDALATLGVDLDAVVARAEAALGVGALVGPVRSARRVRGVNAQAALALRAAPALAAARGDREVGPEHLLLGLLTTPGVVADTLARAGTNTSTVLARLDEARSGR